MASLLSKDNPPEAIFRSELVTALEAFAVAALEEVHLASSGEVALQDSVNVLEPYLAYRQVGAPPLDVLQILQRCGVRRVIYDGSLRDTSNTLYQVAGPEVVTLVNG